jgi:glycosyltransferase involved in cell wall biosynthesis
VRLLASSSSSEAEFLLRQFQAERIADEVGADVVISQCPVQGGLAATRIRKRRRAKTLFEFHMDYYFEPHPLASRQGLLGALARRNIAQADRIRVLSHGMRRRFLDRFGGEFADRVHVLPPRVDLSRFSTVKSDYRIGDPPTVVLVGALTARKGQVRFLEAVLPALPDLSVWIIGEGEERAAIEAASARHGAQRRVRLWGGLAHDTMAQLLPEADAFVMYSSSEGTPRAIMEAMATGLPIVTTNAGFCADIVSDGVEGFVLGGEPDREVIGALEVLLGDEAMRERMGRAARSRAEEEFDSVKLYDRYRALVHETAQA